jgi:hypothetical protein
MAAFSRGPDDITATLSDVIEHLQGDSLQDQAELEAGLLLKELNRLLTFTPNPVKGESGHWAGGIGASCIGRWTRRLR